MTPSAAPGIILAHRREIDGLRACAVVPVVLYHAGLPGFAGGFVGVDIFFVISGFLITSILWREFAQDRFSLLNFYERRARRILPALGVVVLACVPFAVAWLPPAELVQFSRSVVAVTLFVSNFHFKAASGYFEAASELQPLLHTWSLAVEEQFYLLYPLLLGALMRWRRAWVKPSLLAAAAASLALAQATVQTHTGFAYYLLPTRAWELLIGAWAAVQMAQAASHAGQRPPASGALQRALHRRSAGLSLLGLAMIALSIIGLHRETPFPGVWALPPTVGALLVLMHARPDNLAGRLLGTRAFVGIGLVSYSAYLWHQPLLAFARWRTPDLPGQPLLLALVVLTFLLAALTWRWVEQPLRRNDATHPLRWAAGAAVAAGVLLAVGATGWLLQGLPQRQPLYTELAALRDAKESRCHSLERRSAAQVAAGDLCRLGSPSGRPGFAVIGDSHAGALFDELGIAAQRQGQSFYAVSGGFCAPLLNGFRLNRHQDADCRALTDAAFDHVLAAPGIHTIVLVAEWANYTSGWRHEGNGLPGLSALAADHDGTAQRAADNAAVFDRSLAATLQRVAGAGKSVVIVLPVPEFDRHVLDTVTKQRLYSPGAAPPTITVAAYRERSRSALESFGRRQGVSLLPTEDLFCDHAVCRSVDAAGRVLYSDTNHLTEHGARLVADRLMRTLSLPY